MSSTFGAVAGNAPPSRASGFLAGLAASSVTIPHALALGLLAFAPLASGYSLAGLALWSAALPGALLTLLAPRRGVLYAPTTVVALLYAAIVASVMGAAQPLSLSPLQVLAVSGATVALAFGFQWLIGFLRLASLARFLPLSVMHGFAAGVGLSMIISQLGSGFGLGQWAWDWRLVWHAGAAIMVVVLARLLQRRWKSMPGLLPAVAIVAVLIALSGFNNHFVPAAPPSAFAWPPLPDWQGVPWLEIIRSQGTRLVSLALLMAMVNSLDILVFNQELELEHALLTDPNAALRRESLIGSVCALVGMIPASTSASRSRIALAGAGPVASVGPIHAAILLAVAATGHWWLHWVPMACLAGALILAGITQVPSVLWSRSYASLAPAVWTQSWLVATVFAIAGGGGALIAGLVVATFVLMHASASTALRRALLDGQVRSRRLRRAASDAWLAPRMRRLAVVELQGVMSFGVSAHLAEQVKLLLLPHHDRLILDASRVAAWDATAWVRVGALARDLAQRNVETAISGTQLQLAGANAPALKAFADLDRALEWAEDAMLEERSPEDRPAYPANDVLGEIGDGLPPSARSALESRLVHQTLAPHAQAFASGAVEPDILIVQSGRVTLATAWPPEAGMRLATVGQGMAFGEMAFLNGQPRTASAGSENEEVQLVRLRRQDFDAWAADHPAQALTVMGNLAIIGTRRLAATTRQLRAVLE